MMSSSNGFNSADATYSSPARGRVITIEAAWGLERIHDRFRGSKNTGRLLRFRRHADEIPHLLHTAKKELSSKMIYALNRGFGPKKVIAAIHEEYSKAGYSTLRRSAAGREPE